MIFHAHKNGFGFVSLEGEEVTSCWPKWCQLRYRWRHRWDRHYQGSRPKQVGTAAEAKIIDVLEHNNKQLDKLSWMKTQHAGGYCSKSKISQLIYVKKPAIRDWKDRNSSKLINTRAAQLFCSDGTGCGRSWQIRIDAFSNPWTRLRISRRSAEEYALSRSWCTAPLRI